MRHKFNSEHARFQIYNKLQDTDWHVLALNLKQVKRRFFFDLLLGDPETGKIAPILLNEATPGENEGTPTLDIVFSSLLSNLKSEVISSIYIESLALIQKLTATEKTIDYQARVAFSALAAKFSVLTDQMATNPHRRAITGLANYIDAFRSIVVYNEIKQICEGYKKEKEFVTVLDCGCGIGNGAIILSNDSRLKITGIDMDKEATDFASQINLYDNVTFLNESLSQHIENDKKNFYDIVICSEAMEHVDDPEVFMEELISLVKPDGLLIMVLPDARFHGIEYNSDHITNWTESKIRMFFSKRFLKYDLFAVAEAGDDFESELKNRFKRKKTGDGQIPERYAIVASIMDIRNETEKAATKNNDKLKVLYISHDMFPFDKNEVSSLTLFRAREMMKRGHKTAVLLPKSDVGKIEKMLYFGLLFYKIPEIKINEWFFEDFYIERAEYNLDVLEVLKDFKPDIVHVLSLIGISPKIIQFISDLGLPIVREFCDYSEFWMWDYSQQQPLNCASEQFHMEIAENILMRHHRTNDIFAIKKRAEILAKIAAKYGYLKYLYSKIVDMIIYPAQKIKNELDAMLCAPNDKILIFDDAYAFDDAKKVLKIKRAVIAKLENNYYKVLEKFYRRENPLQNSKAFREQVLVSIVIPVYNKLDYTINCIKSLEKTLSLPRKDIEIIVVDNNSTDGTEAFLKQLSDSFTTIINDENLGFSKACNQGAAASTGRYILFLNNDTVALPGWLEMLIKAIEKDKKIGVVGSKLLFPDGTIQHAGVAIAQNAPCPLSPFHLYHRSHADLPEALKSRDYQVVTGACLLIRRELFFSINGYDTNYINGFEDVDLCFKVRERGLRVVYSPESVLYHHESVSDGRFKNTGENILRLHKKWWGKVLPDIVPITRPLTSIIIPCLNQLDFTKECVISIFEFTEEPFELIIIDNGSSDSTADYLTQLSKKHKNVKTIKNKSNLGYAAACNQGLKAARGEWIVLINNDVVVTRGWLSRMIRTANEFEHAAVLGPLTNYVVGQQQIVDVPYSDIEEMHEYACEIAVKNAGKTLETNRIIGFCMLVKSELIRTIGGFDLLFGVGNFEDDDLCLRTTIAGFKVIICLDVFVHHYGSRTFAGERIDYSSLMEENWVKFKEKWGIEPERPLIAGYTGLDLTGCGFIHQYHYCAPESSLTRQKESLRIEGRGKLCLLTVPNWNQHEKIKLKGILKQFINRFGKNEDVSLLIRVNPHEVDFEKALTALIDAFKSQGYDPDKHRNVILLNDPLKNEREVFLASDFYIKENDSPKQYETMAFECDCRIVIAQPDGSFDLPGFDI